MDAPVRNMSFPTPPFVTQDLKESTLKLHIYIKKSMAVTWPFSVHG